MTDVPYRLLPEAGFGRAGLIVLQADETLESDLRQLVPPAFRLHISRVPSGAQVTPDSLAAMAEALGDAAALLPQAPYDIIGYACTSGATVIGPDRVAKLVGHARDTARVTDPLSAACAAMERLGLRRVAILSPYVRAVADALADAFEARGIRVAGAASFGEEVERRVAWIDPASTRDAAIALAKTCDAEAIFLSCTNLQTLGIIEAIEAETGLPCLSSNQVLAWDLARASGVELIGPGRLLA